MIIFRALICASALIAVMTTAEAAPARRPNIVLIYADDLGYGDLGCYGAKRVKTPNLDRLAAQGLRFTDAHSAAATCTPSRYALMTGQYAFRKKGTGILPGDAALIIEPGRMTLPAILKRAGYTTGCVGKWHLGLGAGTIDWNGEVRPGPLEVGFDASFIMPATGDRVPCVYVEGHRVVGLDPADPIRVRYGKPIGDEPTGRARPDLLTIKPSHGHDNTIVNGISRIGYMEGGRSARWVDADMADVFMKQAVAFIDRNKDHPFFLYFATHDIHVPRVPNARFAGKSGCGIRGDVIEEFDASVGAVMAAIDRLKLTDNTLLIVTSDNGPVIDDGYADGAAADLGDHKPAGPLRKGKGTLYEGGTRVPFLARWPGVIRPGTSPALVGQVDLLATFAALVGQGLPEGAGPDSIDVLPALLGESPTGRDHIVEHADALAIRKGPWKLVPGKGGAPAELYNLDDDLGESRDVAKTHPEVVLDLTGLLDRIRKQGNDRPGD